MDLSDIRRNSIYTEPQEQLQVLKEVLSGLQKHSVAGKWSKCEFMVSNVKSEGYHRDVWHPTDEEIAFVNAAEAHTQLGLLKYYKIYLCTQLQPLNKLLRKGKK